MNILQNPVHGDSIHWVIPRRRKRTGKSVRKVSNPNYTKIWVGNRVVGEVRGEMFVKRVRASKHFLRIPPAISFDVDSLKQAKEAGAKSVKIIDTESSTIYRVLISTIHTTGFKIDRGHGLQIALSLKYWHTGDGPLGEQLELWG